MKKIILTILILAVLAILASCQGNIDKTKNYGTESTTTNETAATTAGPSISAEADTDPNFGPVIPF